MKRKHTDHGMNAPPSTTTAQHTAHSIGNTGGSGFNDTGQGGGHFRNKAEVDTSTG